MNDVSDQSVQRMFGYSKILWKIQNVCLSTCKEAWEIYSPEFSVRGPQMTSWKMILKLVVNEDVSDNYYLSVYLERLLSDSGPDVVRANWKLNFINWEKKDHFFAEIEHFFKKNEHFGEYSINVLSSDVESFEREDLHIQSQLIVTCDVVTHAASYFMSSDEGIRSLSEDLHNLFVNGYNSDIVIRIGHRDIPANKAVLHARNSILASIIDKCPDMKVISLLPSNLFEPCSSFINIDAVERIVDYMYSGKLEKVISKPSISLSQCATLFNINEVIAHYIPDELILKSVVDIEENAFYWSITNFELRKEDCIISSPLTIHKGLMRSIWQLKLFPKGFENNEEYLSIYAEIFEGRIMQDVCLEFDIIDSDKKGYCFRRMRKSLKFDKIFGFKDFIKRKSLENAPFLRDGTLRIIFKVRAPSGVPSASIENCYVAPIMAPSNEHNFLSLSEDISHLLNESEFIDFIIHCDNEIFKVHSCIMMARAGNFPELLRKRSIGKNIISIPDIKRNILQILLSYLYSGAMQDFDHDVIHDLYLASNYFGVESLINKCTTLLADFFLK